MDIFQQTVTVSDGDIQKNGLLKLSALLRYAQEASGGHSDLLGFSWDNLAEKGLFWAVLRHRAVMTRLPVLGETLTLQTWPLPATRSAYPRAVRCLDKEGNCLFEVMSLWVLMDMKTRAMVLPGKSGVAVPGIVRGDEIPTPGSIPPGDFENTTLWQISSEDLDINGHVNNAMYLDHVEALTEEFSLTASPREFTVCYLSEVLPGQELTLCWQLSKEGLFMAEGHRTRTDVHDQKQRVFAVRLQYS